MKKYPSRLLLAALLVCPLTLLSQEFRATISGSVTDATGAAIAGAKITVTETQTNTKTETVTDGSGHYNVPFLLPGKYDVSARLEGYKEFVRKAIDIGSGDHPVIDAHMEVGDA